MYKSKGKSKFRNANMAGLSICGFISLNDSSCSSFNTNFIPVPVRLVSGVSIANRFDHIFLWKFTIPMNLRTCIEYPLYLYWLGFDYIPMQQKA